MAEYEARCEVIIKIIANEKGEAAINRYVDLTPEQGKELCTSPGLSRSDVEFILARLAVVTGYDDASRWDGWADLERDDLRVIIDSVQEF